MHVSVFFGGGAFKGGANSSEANDLVWGVSLRRDVAEIIVWWKDGLGKKGCWMWILRRGRSMQAKPLVCLVSPHLKHQQHLQTFFWSVPLSGTVTYISVRCLSNRLFCYMLKPAPVSLHLPTLSSAAEFPSSLSVRPRRRGRSHTALTPEQRGMTSPLTDDVSLVRCHAPGEVKQGSPRLMTDKDTHAIRMHINL